MYKPLPSMLARLLPLLFAPALSFSPIARAAPLEWIAGDLPPFVWRAQDGQGGQSPQGLAYELAILMAAKMSRPIEVQFYPWARAVRMTQEGTSYGVFPLARTADREGQFKWLIPLLHVQYRFFGRAGDGLDLQDLETLRASRVGVLRGSPIIKNLQTENFATVITAKDYKDLLRLLTEGIVDAAYAGEPMLLAAIDEYKLKPQDFRVGASLKSAELYMATSLALEPAEAERWLQAYRELQKEGVVARLQKKYLQREH
jgi:polar amino acid transport system substrate-binding protein